MLRRRRRDDTVVLRLWLEPHDPRLRARLRTSRAEGGIAATGIDEIIEVVRAELEAFVAEVPPTTRDEDATRVERPE